MPSLPMVLRFEYSLISYLFGSNNKMFHVLPYLWSCFFKKSRWINGKILRTTHQHLQQTLFPPEVVFGSLRCFRLVACGIITKIGVAPLAAHTCMTKTFLSFLSLGDGKVDWETGPGRWWCDPKKIHRIQCRYGIFTYMHGWFFMGNVGTWILGVMEWCGTMWPKWIISMNDSLFFNPCIFNRLKEN